MSLREHDPHDRCYVVALECGATFDLDHPRPGEEYTEIDGCQFHLRGACAECDLLWNDLDRFEHCEASHCDGETHFAGRRDPITNEDVEVGPCPNWKAAAA